MIESILVKSQFSTVILTVYNFYILTLDVINTIELQSMLCNCSILLYKLFSWYLPGIAAKTLLH